MRQYNYREGQDGSSRNNPPPPAVENFQIRILDRLIPGLQPRAQLPHPLPNRPRHAQLHFVLEDEKHGKDEECNAC